MMKTGMCAPVRVIMEYKQNATVDEMLGKTLINIDVDLDDNEIEFTASDGTRWVMYHYQVCCERVWIEDVAGDWNDLIGSPLLMSEKVSEDDDSYGLWTFYKFGTALGYLTIRWYGENNYYSMEVEFDRIVRGDELSCMKID